MPNSNKNSATSVQARKAADKKETATTEVSAGGDLYVTDVLATAGPRTHTLLDAKGRSHIYTFADSREQRPVPSEIVISSRLIQNDGFIVRKVKDGAVLKPRYENEETAVLQADETVARYDELSHQALLTRCKNRGRTAYNKATKRDEMITFLMGAEDSDDNDDYEGDSNEPVMIVEEEELHVSPEELIDRLMKTNEALGQQPTSGG